MPRLKRKEIDTRGEQIGQNCEAVIALEGPAAIDRDDIETVPGPMLGTKAETEAFMADKLTILIHPSMEPRPEDPVYVAVNGRGCYIWRNQKSIVARKYVYQLAKAKKDNVTQDPTNVDPAIANKLNISAAQRYPFSVLHDPSPKGAAWLQARLAEV